LALVDFSGRNLSVLHEQTVGVSILDSAVLHASRRDLLLLTTKKKDLVVVGLQRTQHPDGSMAYLFFVHEEASCEKDGQ
jgi:hypothetical protein